MNIQIFGKPKCFDTQKARRWFQERRIPFQMIDFRVKGPSKGELRSVIEALGGLEPLLDPKAKNAALVRYLAYESDRLEKVLEDPLLLRTPIVRNGKQATVGYCPEVWQAWVSDCTK